MVQDGLNISANNLRMCVTGHRPNKLKGKYVRYSKSNLEIFYEMVEVLTNIIENSEYCLTCYSGMALGIDMLFADAVLTVKDNFPERIKLICALPFRNQTKVWVSQDDISFYYSVLEYADEVINVTGEQDFKPYYMQLRNEYMVDNSDVVLAYWNGSSGGTANCVNYAKKKGKKIIVSKTGLLSGKDF